MLIVINQKEKRKRQKDNKKSLSQKHNERMILQEQIKLYKKLLQSIH